MIHVLPPHVARLIAAGEVVSRPLDVVRELVDNALDAGGTRIEIEVGGGGLDLVGKGGCLTREVRPLMSRPGCKQES